MKKLIIFITFIFVSICVEAQDLYGYVKDADDSKRLDFASVVALDENNSPLSYCLTDKNGYFNLSLQDDKKVRTVSVTILGYKKNYCQSVRLRMEWLFPYILKEQRYVKSL